MSDFKTELQSLVSVFRLHYLKMFILALCLATAAYFFVDKQVPYYQSTATILIENKQKDLDLKSVVDAQYEIEQSLARVAAVIQSKSVLVPSAKLNIQDNIFCGVLFEPQGFKNGSCRDHIINMSPQDIEKQQIAIMRRELSVLSNNAAGTLTISYKTTDPVLAKTVLDNILESYLNWDKLNQVVLVDSANAILGDEIQTLKATIQQQEQEIQRYIRENNLVGQNDNQLLDSELQTANRSLIDTQTRLAAAQAVTSQLKNGNYQSAPIVKLSSNVQQLLLRKSTVDAKLAGKRNDLVTTPRNNCFR